MSLSAVKDVIEGVHSLFLGLDRIGGTFTATTVAAAGATAGSQAIPTTGSTTGLVVGAAIRVGEGESTETAYVASLGASQINTVDPLLYDHVTLEPVVELAMHDLGDVQADGLAVTISGQQSPLEVATRRVALTRLNGFLDLGATFKLPAPSLYNIARALGIPLGNVTTAGGVTQLTTDLSDCGTVRNSVLIGFGVKHDGSLFRVELWGLDYDYNAFSVDIALGKSGEVPVKVMAAAGGCLVTGASAYSIGVTTYRAGKADVISALSEIGVFVPETAVAKAFATTLSALATAGDAQVSLTDPSKAKAGTWLKLDAGDTVEYHQIAADTTVNPVALRTKIKYGHAAQAAAVAHKELPFGVPAEQGASLAFQGSGEAIRHGGRRLAIGWKAGTVDAKFSFAVADLSLLNIARALGIDTVANASAIAAGRLPFTSATIGTTNLDGVYVKGTTIGGKTQYLCGWACTQDISNFTLTVARKGIGTTPFAFSPLTVHMQAA